jgi:hypothetical protein
MRDSHVATELKPAIANMLTATVRQQMVVIWLEALVCTSLYEVFPYKTSVWF